MMNAPSDPGFASVYLLEQPWPLAVSLAVIGVGFFIGMVRSGKQWPGGVGVLLLALAGGGVWLASSVTTEREELTARTQQLVQLMAPVQSERLSELIQVNSALRGPDASVWVEHGRLWSELQQIDGRYGLLDHRITDLKASGDGQGNGVVQIDVRTHVRGSPILTRWRLGWQRGLTGEYELTEMQWLEHPIGMQPRKGIWR